MDDLFGISMTLIMLVLVALLGVSLASVGYVALRNRIMFVMGLRNMPRRAAQTVLIIIGLMLSTLIISAAFTIGDTVDHSLTAESYNLLGHVDEWVQRRGEGDGPPRDIDSTLDQEQVERLRTGAQDEGDVIDGILPALIENVPVLNSRSRQSEPAVNFLGIEAGALEAFPDLVSTTTGEPLDVGALGEDEAYINESAADALAARPGDRVQVFVQGQPRAFVLVDVVEDRILSGVGDLNAREGLVTRLDTLQRLFNKPGQVSFIAISNRGGVRDGLEGTDAAIAGLERSIARAGLSTAALEVYDVKRDLVDSFKEAGNFMATFFLILGLFSIAAGMLLIVMIFVMLAAERKSELGMARAVGTKRTHLIQMFMSEGMAYNVLSAMVGAALGVLIAFAIADLMGRIFSEFDINIQPRVTPRSLVISYSLGVVLTFLTVTFASWRVSNLNIVRAIRDIPEPVSRRMGRRWAVTGALGVALGALLVSTGLNSDLAFPFALGFSLVAGGAAVLLRFLGLRERPVFTTAGLLLVLFWGFTAGGRLEFLVGDLEGDVEMFFLSGIAMVTAATFVSVYNADVVLILLSRLGGVFGAILPALRTAIAYPLASKFRTGMTLAMISLVIFALTMMSAMNLNFDRLFLADTARGGWDVVVDENPNNPIADLPAALEDAGSPVAASFRAVGRIGLAGESRVAEIDGGPPDFERYPVFGVAAGFVEGSTIPLGARARRLESDEAVWAELAAGRNVAVVDRFTVEEGGFNFGEDVFHISGIEPDEEQFDPVLLLVHDPVSGRSVEVEVVGVVEFGASATFFGIYVPAATFQEAFGDPVFSRHFVGLDDGGESKEVAREIEAALLTVGVQAESLKERIEDGQALSRNFFLLMQGFMGLGLFVGIAAVGVIAFRTVVERRQQIGMLRAIGYKRSTVALSFVLESSFVTLLGIASGVGLAIWLSYFLLTSDEFPTTGATYAIPWVQIGVIAALTFAASLLMTYIPSRQAASIPTAEALRYE